jgi:hypothetical protein
MFDETQWDWAPQKANKKANNSVSGRPTSSQRVSLPRMSVRFDLQICDRLGFPGTQRNDEVAPTDQKVAGSNPAERTLKKSWSEGYN